jgi:hypothetical protein
VTTANWITLDDALGVLAMSLESMGFVSLAPVDGVPPPPGDDAVAVRLAFDGTARGELVIVAPRAFGRLLAGNVGTAHAGATDAEAEDAIGEVANVVCGRLLRDVGGGKFRLGLPRATPILADDGWGPLTVRSGDPTSVGSTIVDAEGYPVGLGLALGVQA